MQFSTGSFIFIFFIIVVILALIAYNRWQKGQGLSIRIRMPNFRKKEVVSDGMVPCFNVYRNKMIIEDKKITEVLSTWEIKGRDYVFQGCKGEDYFPIMLPDDITYPPDRLARMIGCLPLKRLKSLKFSILENLAPFAPVIALAIGAILLVIMMD